jgi:hypothetical protein
LTLDEFIKLKDEQFLKCVSGKKVDQNGFQTLPRLTEEPNWTNMRRPPFGDVLAADTKTLTAVLQRAGVQSFEKLIDLWHCDLIREGECLGPFSTSVLCAKNLYVNRFEKKVVARYLVSEIPPGDNRPLIAGGEKIALLEGSSGLFAAFAVAAQYGPVGTMDHHVMCAMISSNQLLNAEFFHNPWICKSFRHFVTIGGEIEFDPVSHIAERAGVYGSQAVAQFKLGWEDPGATTLIVPCRGITADVGPLAGAGEVQQLKKEVIKSALEKDVHNIVFISDYSKMLPRSTNGLQEVFTKAEWKKILKEHGELIKIVTTPPPALRTALAEMESPNSRENSPNSRAASLSGFPNIQPVDGEYNKSAIKFQALAVEHNIKFCEALYLTPQNFHETPESEPADRVTGAVGR